MNALTAFQRDSLACIKRQLSDANDSLKKLTARRREFEAASPVAQRQAAEILDAADFADDKILALVVAERKVNFIVGFVSQSAPEISRVEIFIIEQLRQLEMVYVQIFPGGLNKPPHDLPLWAGNGAGASDKAAAAVAEIERLLST